MRYLILDGARMDERLYEAQALNPQHLSLYKGRKEDVLPAVAPYLFTYTKESHFAKWLYEEGWGDSWGIFVVSNASFEDLHRHFRRFLKVNSETGQRLYFRFYDPRVLRIFLPTCDYQQLTEFFGPVQYFLMEDEDPAFALQFIMEDGNLQKKKIPVEKVFEGMVQVEKEVTENNDALEDNSKKSSGGWSHLG